MKKLISVLLALLMMLSLATVVFATEAEETTAPEETTDAAEATEGPAEDAEAAEGEEESKEGGKTSEIGFKDYTTTVFLTEEEKIATMEKKLDLYGYELYIEPNTAEVAIINKATGQTLFTNPYDAATSKGTEATKNKLLSQILVNYTENGTAKEYSSYEHAAALDQIIIKDIKDGIRVEYTIGRANANYLVPRMISKDRLHSEILDNIDSNFYYQKIASFYDLKDPFDPDIAQVVKEEMLRAYPITASMAVYVLTEDINNRELAMMENIIKTYAPDYTYEQMDYDHEITQYEATALSTPVFRMSLEYKLTKDGLEVTLPANGIRFDETLYTLEGITVLPFMGAGFATNKGYTFVPDGSGALMEFGAFPERNTTIAGSVYGTDFAYQTLEGSPNQDVIRMPVYGLVETRQKTVKKDVEKPYIETVVTVDPETGEEITEEVETTITVQESVRVNETRGFFAIIEEGAELAKISAKHENQLHSFNGVQVSVNPRPKDSYVLSDSISVGSSSEIQVVSKRKYVDNYKFKYIMLTDPVVAEAKGVDEYYETSWMGMARAYRDYLLEKGTITRLDKSDVKDQIPLYIETFGSTETIEKVLSVPTTVSKSLTSFEDIETIYDELAKEGINNINFKLTGYANGGMHSTVPAKLKWEKSVGGSKGFEKLVAAANEKGFTVYPDFDFTYVRNHATFDGLSLDDDIVKTIDNRYSSLREYDASLQEYVSYFTLCVSPASFSNFYGGFAPKYSKYENAAISLSTIANTLNSDFNEDEPYNRVDSRDLTVDFLKQVKNDVGSIMSEKPNAYAWPYVDKMLGVSLESSRSLYASASVPFMGVVLHGCVEFAGTPINMAGDIDYEILKAIENGSGIYFILSYDNTEYLKEDYELSKYYSVRYDIWKDELVDRYSELNAILADLQTSIITGHEFLIGERVASAEEMEADQIAAAAQKEAEKAAQDEKGKQVAMAQMREQYLAGEIGAGETIVPIIEEKPTKETEGYQYTKYTSDDNSIVRVTYENG
ncbi:MAG: hypothetical protein IKU61_04645, partial [Clostridia bacterium]|nr:hypothetical protein [Clostridia bacterium]